MAKDTERRAELFEHLGELRTRLMRSFAYIVLGMVVAWFFYDAIYTALTRQMDPILKLHDSKFLFTNITEPFMLRMHVTLAAGLILVLPLLMFEIWGFISPGLTPSEKRPLRWTVPLAIALFALGAAICYSIMPLAFKWFAYYVPTNAELRPSVPVTIKFQLLMLLGFGCAFELPIVLMLLAQVGIINSKMLKDSWRYGVVGVFLIAATLTPSNDVFSMLSMALPLTGLYVGSIWLVKMVEKKKQE